MHHLGLGAEGLGVKSLTTALTVFFSPSDLFSTRARYKQRWTWPRIEPHLGGPPRALVSRGPKWEGVAVVVVVVGAISFGEFPARV